MQFDKFHSVLNLFWNNGLVKHNTLFRKTDKHALENQNDYQIMKPLRIKKL